MENRIYEKFQQLETRIAELEARLDKHEGIFTSQGIKFKVVDNERTRHWGAVIQCGSCGETFPMGMPHGPCSGHLAEATT